MSETEDYLDKLLYSVEKGNEPETPEKESSLEDDFLDDFEKELLGTSDDDDFLRDFEKELVAEDAPEEETLEHTDPFFDNLDGIVNDARANMQEKEDGDNDDFIIDTIGDMPEEPSNQEEPEEEEASGDEIENEDVELDQDLMDLLRAEGEFPETNEETFQTDNQEEPELIDPDSFDALGEVSLSSPEDSFTGLDETPLEDGTKEASEKENAKEKKGGFLQKLSHILFGEDEEEAPTEEKAPKKPIQMSEMDNLSEESLQLLQELGDAPAESKTDTAVEEEDSGKKKKKKEKKKKEKKPKEKKPKKPKKEKKPKPPKEPDLTPPLPKKPVMLVFVMAASFLILVLVGTKLLGYSNGISEAERNYGLGNYKQAYQEISGMELKEEDQELYEKCWIMANVAGEYEAYQTFMQADVYDMALDSLVRAIGRCEKYRPDAENYGCINELDKLGAQIQEALRVFGITTEQALELYHVENRGTYSTEIYNILAEAGYKVTE